MASSYEYTQHARDRLTARAIPPAIIQLIIEYGLSRDAGEGARKYALAKDSMREIRRDFGREIAKVIEPYRSRNAYVVATGERIITSAFASRFPL